MKSLLRALPEKFQGLAPTQTSPLLLALPFLLLTFVATSDVIREGDQASLLDGMFQLVAGNNPFHIGLYNYDKQYITFWLGALLIHLKQLLRLPFSEIYLTNLLSYLLLWSGFLSVLSIARHSTVLLLVALCVLTAPSFLLQTPFLSAAAISSGFLLWLAWSLLKDRPSPLLVSALLTVAAIGARADAVLAMPLLLWLASPSAELGKLIRSRQSWIVVGASVFAIILGKLIYPGQGIDTNSFFLYPSIFITYFVFGLGAAGALYLFCVLAIARRAAVAPTMRERLYMGVGIVFILMPFLFYAAQLLSIRYWMLTVDTVICFGCAPRGQAIIQQFPFPSLKRVLGIILVVLCLLPLAVGVQFPFLKSPRITLTTPTLFPTADGVMPMGAYTRFLVPRLSNANTQFVDHNQVLWQAAQNISFELGSSGSVPVLETHVPMYIRLAATMQGKRSELIPPEKSAGYPFLYAESRSFTKEWTELNNPDGYKHDAKQAIQRLLAMPAAYQSKRYAGIGVLKFGSGDRRWSEELLMLNRTFQGNEYQILPAYTLFQKNSFLPSSDDWGKMIVFYSIKPFALSLVGQSVEQPLKSSPEPNSAFHSMKLKGADWFRKRFRVDDPESLDELSLARSAFPDWMAMGRVKK